MPQGINAQRGASALWFQWSPVSFVSGLPLNRLRCFLFFLFFVFQPLELENVTLHTTCNFKLRKSNNSNLKKNQIDCYCHAENSLLMMLSNNGSDSEKGAKRDKLEWSPKSFHHVKLVMPLFFYPLFICLLLP